jgi:glycine betaine/proline transport system permease protein
MYKVPIGDWIDVVVNWLLKHFSPFFDGITATCTSLFQALENFLLWIPWWIIILFVAALAWYLSGKARLKMTIGSIIGLLFIYDMGHWHDFILTLNLVLICAGISLLIGIPIGILSGKNDYIHAVTFPSLDIMMTMPSFVYLLPAMFFFGIGLMPAIFATIIFALPPIIRLTDLGIRQIPKELLEAAHAFGSSTSQILLKVELPVAIPAIMAGVNQTIMLALSMVVISSLIGAGGLGDGVNQALGQVKIGTGFEYGISIVIMALIMDRITQRLGEKAFPYRK